MMGNRVGKGLAGLPLGDVGRLRDAADSVAAANVHETLSSGVLPRDLDRVARRAFA